MYVIKDTIAGAMFDKEAYVKDKDYKIVFDIKQAKKFKTLEDTKTWMFANLKNIKNYIIKEI